MAKQRWMKWVLEESAKTDVVLPWGRSPAKTQTAQKSSDTAEAKSA